MDKNNDIIPQQPNLPTEQPSQLPTTQPSKQPSKQASKQPLTIEELRQWYIDRHLPPENVTRFFIGKNIREPKAFGIYKDANGNFVVYKNKANGERAVRYQGRDEAFAVGELLNRLKEEILRRKSKSAVPSTGNGSDAAYLQHGHDGSSQRSAATSTSNSSAIENLRDGCILGAGNLRDGCSTGGSRKGCFLGGIIAAVLALFIGIFGNSVPNGYYQYNDNYYYHLGSAWYIYNALTSEWAPTASLDEWITEENAEQYSTSSFNGSPFEETGWYEDYYSSDTSSDSDSDYDWDDSSDNWDSDDTDWDDDW